MRNKPDDPFSYRFRTIFVPATLDDNHSREFTRSSPGSSTGAAIRMMYTLPRPSPSLTSGDVRFVLVAHEVGEVCQALTLQRNPDAVTLPCSLKSVQCADVYLFEETVGVNPSSHLRRSSTQRLGRKIHRCKRSSQNHLSRCFSDDRASQLQ